MVKPEALAMKAEEIYVSTDVETDGPLPGVHSMLSIGSAAYTADKVLIDSVRVFDQFAGEKAEAQMGAGKKSLAITVRLQPQDKTLTEETIEAVSAKIVEKVAKATGGVLRG